MSTLYVSRDRVKAICDTLAECLYKVAGIRLHQGKTRVWNRGGVQPADVALLGPDVWQPQGVMVSGTPIGSPQFTADRLQIRIEEERRLWEAIPYVSDLQCGWQILLQSANPRANHTLRTVPPSFSREYAVAHDEGLWGTGRALLGQIPGSADELSEARSVATLPMRMGGLGLRCAERIREAACWSSWADALSMIHHRNPLIADLVVERLDNGPLEGCLEELAESTRKLDDEGFWWRPSWTQLRAGGRPPQVDVGGEPGEWQHGWRTRSGRIKKRATPTERTVARIFREAGACVRQNVFLRDMNINVAAQDSRRIEVLAQDLPCFSGAQLAVDITLRSALTSNGEAPSGGRR